MEVQECTSVTGRRKRTESNGGSSDSDLSEGWNIVDHLDTNSPEVPSSDGESVEVIEGEDDIPQDANAEVEAMEALEFVNHSDCPEVVSVDEPQSVVLPSPTEEMFDSSFCWFLLTTAFAVLVSHLAFMAAENALTWNTSKSYDSPSFLRDLPTTSQPLCQSNFADKVSWASDGEENVNVLHDMLTEESRKIVQEKFPLPRNENVHRKENKLDKLTLRIDNHDLEEYFRTLSDMTSSVEAQKKFSQAMLILDALHVGINDLEELNSENSELNQVLKKQRNKLTDVLNEIKFGVSRSLDRLATNVFNKIQTMERRFEKQWCKLEKNGFKEELKGLFYDCEARSGYEKEHSPSKINGKDVNENIDVNKKKNGKVQKTVDNYKYEVDKDSTGKVHSKEIQENGDNSEYYKLLTKENKNNKIKHKHKDFTRHNDIKSSKFRNKNQEGSKRDNFKHVPAKKIKEKRHIIKEKPDVKSEDRDFVKHKEKPVFERSTEEFVSKFLKGMCEKNKENLKKATETKNYHRLKEEVDKKVRTSKELFKKMFLKFCVRNSDNVNKENLKHNKKENLLKKSTNFKNMIIDAPSTKNILNFKLTSSSELNNQENETPDMPLDKVIEPVDQNEWTLSYEIPQSVVNETNADGYWFIKSGESRSHVRWSHQRSDWWFDRSSHRRHYQFNYPQPSNWFVGRRKNWFFRRAWARQHCRDGPQNSWCQVDDDTVTIPNSNFS